MKLPRCETCTQNNCGKNHRPRCTQQVGTFARPCVFPALLGAVWLPPTKTTQKNTHQRQSAQQQSTRHTSVQDSGGARDAAPGPKARRRGLLLLLALIVLSRPPDTSLFPSVEKVTQYTDSVCPSRRWRILCVCVDHTCTTRSIEAAATILVSCENKSETIGRGSQERLERAFGRRSRTVVVLLEGVETAVGAPLLRTLKVFNRQNSFSASSNPKGFQSSKQL